MVPAPTCRRSFPRARRTFLPLASLFYGMARGDKGIPQRISAEDLVGPEWAEWYAMTPAERMRESGKLWSTFLALGGSLDPEPDTQSPFFDADAPRESTAHGRSGVRLIRRR